MARRGSIQYPEESVGDEPCYVISVAARMVGAHAQTLRSYERLGLLGPARSRGNVRLYSPREVERARWIKSLVEDLGVNLAGVEVIMRMSTQMAEMERRIQELLNDVERVRQDGPLPSPQTPGEAKG